MGEPDSQDIDLILAFLEDRLPEAQAATVAARLKTDKQFARQLAIQARMTATLEAAARVEALTPTMRQTKEAEPVANNAEKSGKEPKKVTRLTRAQTRSRTRFIPAAAAAILLGTLGLGGWWLSSRPADHVTVNPPVKVLPPETRVAVAQVEFVPGQLAANERPLIIRQPTAGTKNPGEAAEPGMTLYAGDRIVTSKPAGTDAAGVQISLKHTHGAVIDVGADSELQFPADKTAPGFNIDQGLALQHGRMFIDLGEQATPAAAGGMPAAQAENRPANGVAALHISTQGTDFVAEGAAFELATTPERTVARVQTGMLTVLNQYGRQVVHALEECAVAANAAPTAPVTIFAGAIWRGRHGMAGGEPAPNVALAGALVLERPTLVCLGARWVVQGDANRNAVVYCKYRPVAQDGAAAPWRRSLNFWAVDVSGWPDDYKLDHGPGPGDVLYAGSLFDLQPGTAYELEFHLDDPDGQAATRWLQATTRTAPTAVADGRQLFVAPDPSGQGGGSGTAADPFRGLAAADKAAQPGDRLQLAPGTYTGEWKLTHSGEPDRPIVWQGAPGGASIIEGAANAAPRPDRVISAHRLHDIIFDGLSMRNAHYLVVAHGAQRLAFTHCQMSACMTAITAGDKDAPVEDFYIADSSFTGEAAWPTPKKGDEPSRAIYLCGQGHVICHNRLANFGDGIDTAPGRDNAAIDIYLNDISAMTDDGIELDFSHRNIRCFQNRLTNLFQGISVQPVHGGPVYVLRNTIYNVELEPFKLHSSPHGALFYHNTTVRNRAAAVLSTSDPVYRCVYRNNLLIGTQAPIGLNFDAPMLQCDLDYDGIGGSFDKFLMWNRTLYTTAGEVRGIEMHATVFDPAGCFVDGPPIADGEPAAVKIGAQDLRLAPKSPAIDKGCVLPGINDDYQGQAPDLGAFEAGQPLPAYGPRSAAP